jgi:hypothetical protein
MNTEATTKPSVEEMNKAIAIFDGWEFVEGHDHKCPSCDEGYAPSMYCTCDKKRDRLAKDDIEKLPNEFYFDSSWDALMPVVEKISKMPLLNVDNTPCTDYIDTCYPITFNMPTEDGKVMFRFKGFSLHEAYKLIDAVHAAVYEVAEYHNKQNR